MGSNYNKFRQKDISLIKCKSLLIIGCVLLIGYVIIELAVIHNFRSPSFLIRAYSNSYSHQPNKVLKMMKLFLKSNFS